VSSNVGRQFYQQCAVNTDNRANARRIASLLADNFPEIPWTVEIKESGELEMFVEAPETSVAGALIVLTNEADVWVRFAPPQLFYSIDDDAELLRVVRGLLAGDIAFKRTSDSSGSWVETTLVNLCDFDSENLNEHECVVSW
jgi:hypothetical protein